MRGRILKPLQRLIKFYLHNTKNVSLIFQEPQDLEFMKNSLHKLLLNYDSRASRSRSFIRLEQKFRSNKMK